MSLKHHNRKTVSEPMTPAQLVHELNNLLDGSLRSVGFALRQLKDLDLDAAQEIDLAKRLHTADRSMHLMADVIERYANDQDHHSLTSAELVNSRGSLLDVLTHAVNVYGPSIEQRGIELITRLDPEAADLPAGPVYTVLANGLNNALQAISRRNADVPHRITVRLLAQQQDVLVQIRDTGPGFDAALFDRRGAFRFGITTRPEGHGVGLGVCQQIAQDLGGTLELTPAPGPDGGAQLTLRYPQQLAPPNAEAFGPEGEARRAG